MASAFGLIFFGQEIDDLVDILLVHEATFHWTKPRLADLASMKTVLEKKSPK